MRKMLFRGKRPYNGEWVEGYLMKANWYMDEKPIVAIIPTDSALFPHCEISGWEEVDPSTIGQYTGLTDKNGKKIFEGDIVKGLFLFGMEIYSQVCFKDGAFGLACYRGNVLEFNAFTSICNVVFEVVGNVHDNPELLEKRSE